MRDEPTPARPPTVSLADEDAVRRVLSDTGAVAAIREHHARWLAARPARP